MSLSGRASKALLMSIVAKVFFVFYSPGVWDVAILVRTTVTDS